MPRSEQSVPGSALTAVTIDTPAGTFVARFSEHGLAQLDFPGSKRPANTRPSETCTTHSNPRWIELTNKAVLAILSGHHPAEFPPLDVSTGSGFQQRVWSVLRRIPPGETRSYGEVAAAIHSPKAPRAVGSACGANPIPLLIPCHRVLAGGGRLGGFSGGLEWKKRLLMVEGAIAQELPARAEPPGADG